MSSGGDPVIEARGVAKVYEDASGHRLEILRGLDLAIGAGEAVAITGQSGSGKSTLLHIVGLLDRPSAGEVRVAGMNSESLDSERLAELRNRHIGFVFQFHHLLREFSALENVMIPQWIAGRDERSAKDRAETLLHQVGLSHRLTHRPTELSGGEQQRVAVARALANDPSVILADEPSGNLDRATSDALHDLLFDLRERHGLAMVLVTHNATLADRADRTLLLRDGVLHEERVEPVHAGLDT